MVSSDILISKSQFSRTTLAGRVAVITGAGGGIGFEAARAMAWLGATVIIAEIESVKGASAAERINVEMDQEIAYFYTIDISKEEEIKTLARLVYDKHGPVDIVINNATLAPLGAIKDSVIADWDMSYGVNLRGPVLLGRSFLPGMVERNYGVFINVSSSGAAPYMGPYEVLKVAQTELGYTIASELEGTGVSAFTIGPGLVKTTTALNAIEKIAPLYGKNIEEFFEMNANQILSAEAAGTGFALAVVLAQQFHGQEIGSIQVLHMAGLSVDENGSNEAQFSISDDLIEVILPLLLKVQHAFNEQYDGWKRRPVFERMWVLRDFNKYAGVSADQYQKRLDQVVVCCENKDYKGIHDFKVTLDKLIYYIRHQQNLAEGYMKDKEKLQEALKYLKDWEMDAVNLKEAFSTI